MSQPAAPAKQEPATSARLQPLSEFTGSLGQRVYQTLRKAILSLAYRPGEILRKPDICEALEKAGIATVSAESNGLLPMTTVTVSDVAVARAVNKFVNMKSNKIYLY